MPYAHCQYHARAIDDHEERLRRLERVYWKIAGAAALAAFLGGVAARLL